jgi:hypothetical protein
VTDTFRGKIALPLRHGAVLYDGMRNEFYHLPIVRNKAETFIEIELPVYASCVIFDELMSELPTYVMEENESKSLKRDLDISRGWKRAFSPHGKYPEFGKKEKIRELKPFSEEYPKFSGHISYEKEVEIEEITDKMYLEIENVGETMDLWINDEYIGFCLTPPYRYEVNRYLRPGKNLIRIEVSTTLDRDQANYPPSPVKLSYEAQEATGMYGKVRILY